MVLILTMSSVEEISLINLLWGIWTHLFIYTAYMAISNTLFFHFPTAYV